MSAGAVLDREVAMTLASHLVRHWPGVQLVGSLRRGHSARDIDLVAPLPATHMATEGKIRAEDDPLFRIVNACVENQWVDPDAGGLFNAAGNGEPKCSTPWGKAVRGLKPGFLAAQLLLHTKTAGDVPVQIFRYTPLNKGWVIIERTGPVEFGKYFLGSWKKRHGIPLGDPSRPASIENHLVDSHGRVVPVADEAAAFGTCGMPWVDPDYRDEYLQRQRNARELLRG